MGDGLAYVTPEELSAIAGQILAVTVLTNGIGHLTGWPRRYLGFAISVVIYGSLNWQAIEWSGAGAIAFVVNTFIVYTASVGTTSMIDRKDSPGGSIEEIAPRKIFSSWW